MDKYAHSHADDTNTWCVCVYIIRCFGFISLLLPSLALASNLSICFQLKHFGKAQRYTNNPKNHAQNSRRKENHHFHQAQFHNNQLLLYGTISKRKLFPKPTNCQLLFVFSPPVEAPPPRAPFSRDPPVSWRCDACPARDSGRAPAPSEWTLLAERPKPFFGKKKRFAKIRKRMVFKVFLKVFFRGMKKVERKEVLK